MLTVKKTLLLLVPLSTLLILFQNCSSDYKMKAGQEIVSLEEGVATVEVTPKEGEEELLLKVPSELVTEAAAEKEEEAYKWLFIDEDGNEVDLQNTTSEFDLTGLDRNFFSHGNFKVILRFNQIVKVVVFVIHFNTNSQFAVGLQPNPDLKPPIVVGEPSVIGIIHRPVVGVPPVVGIIHRPVVGIPPVVGMVRPLVVGLQPSPNSKPPIVVGEPAVIGMVRPLVVGLQPNPDLKPPIVVGEPAVVGMVRPLVVGLQPNPNSKPPIAIGISSRPTTVVGRRVLGIRSRSTTVIGRRVFGIRRPPVGRRVLGIRHPPKVKK